MKRLVFVLMVMFMVACGSRKQPQIDDRLLAWLSMARALHHEADIAEDQNQLDLAVDRLQSLLQKPRIDSPESREIVQDTHARLAELFARQNQFEKARSEVAQGLELSNDISYYRGHLFEVAGVVDEREAKSLEKAGDSEGAKRARARAVASYEQSVKIQSQFIEQSSSSAKEKP